MSGFVGGARKRFNVIFVLGLIVVCLGDVQVKRTINTTGNQKNNGDGNPSIKIIGGSPADFGEYPWFVSGNGCGGSLVTESHVLTAAHCVDDFDDRPVRISALCTNVLNCGQSYEEFTIEKKIIHPYYNEETNTHDFAILKLNEKSTIAPVPLDTDNLSMSYNSDNKLWVLGFGRTDPDSYIQPTRLQHVEVSYVAQESCNVAYGSLVNDSMMCAADSGEDACQGDSGGPLYDKVNDKLVGIVSWGYGCAHPSYPGVYARIADQWSWLKETICSDFMVGEDVPSFCRTAEPTRSPSPTPSPSIIPSRGPWCDEEEIEVLIELTTDFYGNELSWEVVNTSTNVTISSGENLENFQTYTEKLCISARSCNHIFTINDSYGDGISYQGKLKITVDGNEIPTNTQFGFEWSVPVGTKCAPTPSPSSAPSTIAPTRTPWCQSNETSLLLEIITDSFPSETSWAIRDLHTRSIVESGSSTTAYSQSVHKYCLPNDINNTCHEIIIYDSFGDGISGDGGYRIFANNNLVEDYFGNGLWRAKSTTIGCSKPILCNDDEMKVDFEIITDMYGHQTKWEVLEYESRRVVSSGDYFENQERYNINFCLPLGCYDFIVHDSGENGIKSPGGFVIQIDGEEVFNQPGYTLSQSTEETGQWSRVLVEIGCNSCNSNETNVSVDLHGTIFWDVKDLETGNIMEEWAGYESSERIVSNFCLIRSCYEFNVYTFSGAGASVSNAFSLAVGGKVLASNFSGQESSHHVMINCATKKSGGNEVKRSFLTFWGLCLGIQVLLFIF